MLFLLQHNTTGFTCREVSLILKKIKDPVNRFEAFENMLGYILDTENRWVALDMAFFFEKGSFQHKIMEKKLIAMNNYPRSSLFGKIQGKRVLFVLPTINNFDVTFTTSQGERIDRFRFMIRDVSRILREQLNEYVYFDVIAYGTAFASWSNRGLVPVNDENVESCCRFLRSLTTRGGRFFCFFNRHKTLILTCSI